MLSLLFLPPGNCCWLIIFSFDFWARVTERVRLPRVLRHPSSFFGLSIFPLQHRALLTSEWIPRRGCPWCPLVSRATGEQGCCSMAFSFPILSWSLDKFSIFIWHKWCFIHFSRWLRDPEYHGCEEDGKLGLGKNETYCQIASTFRAQKIESAFENVGLICQCSVEWQCPNLALHSEERAQQDGKPWNLLHQGSASVSELVLR